MARCKSCGKWVLLRLEKETGLCVSCKAAFAEKAKPLTQKLMEVETMKLTERSDDPKSVVAHCEAVEESAKKLLALKQEYSLEPGPELTEIMKKYAEIKQNALNSMKG